MLKNWIWIGKYVFVIVVALLLGLVLGSLDLFRAATLGSPRLTAAVLARFISYAGALAFFWLLGRRVSDRLGEGSAGPAMLAAPVLALTTLVVVPCGYAVLMELLRPFLSHGLVQAVGWLFIVGTITAAVWLVWELFVHADAVLQTIVARGTARRQTA